MSSQLDFFEGRANKANPVSDDDLYHPAIRRALDYIHTKEGSPTENTIFGGKKFDDYSDHPNISVPFNDGKDKSTAAGKYQIIHGTWKDQQKKQGLTDFSSENQDRAAVGILRDTGALDAIKKGDIEGFKKLAGKQWTSIPGSKIGLSTNQKPNENSEHERILEAPDPDSQLGMIEAWQANGGKQKEPEVSKADKMWKAGSDLINGKDSNILGRGKVTTSNEALKDSTQEFVKGAASLADNTIGGVLPFVAKNISYPILRAAQQSPEKATEMSDKLAGFVDKPFGKAVSGISGRDITQDEGYKKEASSRAMEFVGENLSKGADWISEKTGIPKSDVDNIIQNFVGSVAPEAGRLGKNVAKAGLKEFSEFTPSSKSAMEQQFAERQKKGYGTDLETQFKNRKGEAVEPAYKPGDNFTEKQYSEKSLPADQVAHRKAVLDRTVGDALDDVAPNVVEGRGKERKTDWDIANTDTALGHKHAELFEKEKQAQNKYGERLIEETGGTLGTDESTLYKRGESIIKPLEELNTHLDDDIKSLYKERDQVASQIPVVANDIKKVLSTESEVQGHEATVSLAKGANARLKELGMMDKDGNMLPATAEQAEQFRQYLNSKWTPQNAGLTRLLKEATDSDVFRHAGENIHSKARELYQYKKDTLDNPKGIASLLDTSGPKGMNRKVNIERVADTIANMPVDQFDHIIKTLDSVPEKLQPAAQKAKAEIKSQFMNRAHEQFQKSASAGTKYLNANKEVFSRLFTPEELNKINDYNDLAHILKVDKSYKGAAVQSLNLQKGLGRKALDYAIKKGAGATAFGMTGGSTFGLAEFGAHEIADNMIKKYDTKREIKLLEKKMKNRVKLSDLTGSR
jgi:muramidase (phage lysozyme)